MRLHPVHSCRSDWRSTDGRFLATGLRASGHMARQTLHAGRAAQSSHLPCGLAGPLNISHLPQAVSSAPVVKKRHLLQVLPGSGDLSV